MDKRNVMKVMSAGTLGLIMAGTGGKSVLAAESPDWRDDLLEVVHKNNAFQIYYKSGDDITNSLYIFGQRNGEIKFTVNHMVLRWKQEEDGNFTSERLLDEETKFDTLKEAYLYAKELKAKHYG